MLVTEHSPHTVTLKIHSSLLFDVSWHQQVTVVLPIGNCDPESWSHDSLVTSPESS